MASVEYHGQKGRAAYERKAVEKESIGAGIARLYRGKVLDSSSWTPGSIQPTRLAIIDSTTAVVASGGEMYRIEVSRAVVLYILFTPRIDGHVFRFSRTLT